MISADSHVVEPAVVLDGLADEFGDDAPRIVDHAHQRDLMHVPATGVRGLAPARLAIAGYRLDGPLAVDRTQRAKPDPEDPAHPAVVELESGGYGVVPSWLDDPLARLSTQDADGVTAEVMYPSMFFTVFGLPNVEVVVAAFRRYNDWLHEYCSESADRLIGAPLIPLHDPEAGLEELRRSVERGARTACIPCRAPHDRPYRDAAYEPIWALAEEARLPLAMHIGTNAWAPRAPKVEGLDRHRDPVAQYAGAASVIQRTISELICQGVVHRHPQLKFVVSEFNAGWLPNWLERLDQGWMRDPTAVDASLDRAPSEYWATNFLATIEDDRSAVLCRELIGIDNLMWGNDFPHRDSTWPCSQGVADAIFEGVPDDHRERITAGTARALYRL